MAAPTFYYDPSSPYAWMAEERIGDLIPNADWQALYGFGLLRAAGRTPWVLTEERERARETAHSTARQAAELAAEAEVALLALTHLSPRHPPGVLRAVAREAFEHTIVPRDFDRVELPLPERGEPRHVRWDEEPLSEAAG